MNKKPYNKKDFYKTLGISESTFKNFDQLEMFLATLYELNKKNYFTAGSCCAHPDRNVDTAYLMFKRMYDFDDEKIPGIHICNPSRRKHQVNRVIYWDVKTVEERDALWEKLYLWACNLPEKEPEAYMYGFSIYKDDRRVNFYLNNEKAEEELLKRGPEYYIKEDKKACW